MVERLTVKAAAIRHNGVLYWLDPPARHGDVMGAIEAKGIGGPYGADPADQGFILSDGRYSRREWAGRIAIKSGQIKKLKWPPRLYSEDLW